MFHDHKQQKTENTHVSLTFLFILFYFYFKGYIHAKVEHVITMLLNKVQK